MCWMSSFSPSPPNFLQLSNNLCWVGFGGLLVLLPWDLSLPLSPLSPPPPSPRRPLYAACIKKRMKKRREVSFLRFISALNPNSVTFVPPSKVLFFVNLCVEKRDCDCSIFLKEFFPFFDEKIRGTRGRPLDVWMEEVIFLILYE